MSCRTLIRVTLSVGLMKPRRGFTLVAGREKPGVGKPDAIGVPIAEWKMRRRKTQGQMGRNGKRMIG